MNQPNVYIYALLDPRDGAVRYIGQSVRPSERLANHCNERGASWRHHWLSQLLALNLRPILLILEEVPLGKDWKEAECRWIERGRAEGHRLTNCTSGGDGVSGLPAEVRARMRLTWLGRKHRPESLKRIGRASRGRRHTREYRAHMRALMTGRKITWTAAVSKSLCKLSAEQVGEVKRLISEGYTQRSIAARFNVNSGTISNIHRGKGYIWMAA